MAITGMATADEDAISSFAEGIKDEAGVNSSAAHDADAHQIGRIFHAGSTRQVGAGVTAPIAEETYDFRFKAHINIPSIWA